MNDLIRDVRRIREANAKKCNYEIDAIYEEIKRGEDKLAKDGWKLVNRHEMLVKEKKAMYGK